MSNLLNKAKEALSGNSGQHSATNTTSTYENTPQRANEGTYIAPEGNYASQGNYAAGGNTLGSGHGNNMIGTGNTYDAQRHTETVKTGPVHHNEVLNKVDPRVHEHKTTTTATHHDPTDAARAPPSVVQRHLGEPSIEHDYPHDSKHKRHSVSHQEAHMMK